MRRTMAGSAAGAVVVAASLLFVGVSTVHAQPIDPTGSRTCSDTPDGRCWTCTTNDQGQRECYGYGQDCVRGPHSWTCIPESTVEHDSSAPPSGGNRQGTRAQ